MKLLVLFTFIINMTSNPIDVIFVGGLDGAGYKSLNEQVRIFKSGFGKDKSVMAFRYNDNSNEIINAISKNKSAKVVLFSAGCRHAVQILKRKSIDPNRIWMIEPYAPNPKLSAAIEGSDIPKTNIYVGSIQARGRGIVMGASSSKSSGHWASLENVAKQIK
jgi:hypothetical protein